MNEKKIICISIIVVLCIGYICTILFGGATIRSLENDLAEAKNQVDGINIALEQSIDIEQRIRRELETAKTIIDRLTETNTDLEKLIDKQSEILSETNKTARRITETIQGITDDNTQAIQAIEELQKQAIDQ